MHQDPATVSARINAAMRQTRNISELVGLCKGIFADGTLS